MEVIMGLVVGIVVVGFVLFSLWEFRFCRPDILVLYESGGRIRIRRGIFYPRHLSLTLKRITTPIKLTIEATAAGNLGVRIKLAGSVAPSIKHIHSLVRVGGWDHDAVVRAAEEAQTYLEGLVKEYAERFEIQTLTSTNLLSFLNDRAAMIEEQFGLELISLAVQTLEPTDPEITDALRQQNQARLLEETERLNQQARAAAAKAKYQADEEIAKREHALDLKKAELRQILLEKETSLAQKRLQDELERSRLRLAFEKEELQVFLNSPELLMLTPQAARLAEASQNLRNARTIISLAPQETTSGSELLNLFQNLLQKALEARKEE
jgi:hypothetical protein